MSPQTAIGGVNETTATTLFAILFLFALGKAFVAIRQGKVSALHREWMILVQQYVVFNKKKRIVKPRIIHSRCSAILPWRMATNALPNANRNRMANNVVAVVSLTPPIAIWGLITRAVTPTIIPDASTSRPGRTMQAGPARAQRGNELQRTQHHEQESGNDMDHRQ